MIDLFGLVDLRVWLSLAGSVFEFLGYVSLGLGALWWFFMAFGGGRPKP
jgi:hypothetical protein